MLNIEDYNQEELTVSTGKTHLLGYLFPLPFVAIFCFFYYLVWGVPNLKTPFIQLQNNFGNFSILILLFILFISIVLHEFIHGITLSQFTSDGSTSIKYGVNWKYFAPYCSCKEALLVKHYLIGIIMPAIFLGFIPSILAICIQSSGFLVFGIIMTFAAGGDFIITKLLINEPKNDLVLDHPSKVGCYIYRAK
jgi:Putative zincin peptidase